MSKRGWMLGSAAVAGLVLVILLAYTAVEARRRQVFFDFVDGLRAAGEPTTFAELNPPEPPDSENAAPEIEAALNSVYEQFGPEKTWPDVGPWGTTRADSFEDETPERVAAEREFIRRFDPFCERVAAALERPRLRFRLVLDPMGHPDGSATRTLQSVQRILAAQALAGDDPRRRVEASRTLLLLARRNEALSSIDVMVGAAVAASAANALRIGVERGEVDAGIARQRVDSLLESEWTAAGRRMFRAEVVTVISNYQAALDGRASAAMSETNGPFWQLADPSFIVEGTEMVREASRLPAAPLGAYLLSARAIDDRTRATGNLIPIVVLKVVESLGRFEAATRLARVALAVAEHRAKHGDFPASLDDLKWAFPDGVPLDPYTDAPFAYTRPDSGVRLASLGRLAADTPLDEPTLRERCLVWELTR